MHPNEHGKVIATPMPDATAKIVKFERREDKATASVVARYRKGRDGWYVKFFTDIQDADMCQNALSAFYPDGKDLWDRAMEYAAELDAIDPA